MPSVYPASVSSHATTMTTISGITNSTTSYATLNSPHINNITTSSINNQEFSNTTTAPTQYIQLQPVRPSTSNSVSMMQVSQSVPGTLQRMPNAATVPAGPQRPRTPMTSGINIPPGMALTRTSNGQLVLVNSNQIPNSSSQQSPSSTQPIVSTSTRIVTTVASVTSCVSVTTVGKPVSVVSPVTTVTKPTESKPSTNSSPITLSQDDIVNVNKCRNFLTTLIKLASTGSQLQETVRNVKALVQNLIDDKISPEDFTKRLQIELKSSPQPYLVPFLQRSLPLLRLTMMQQNQGGQVPTTVAQAAIRASTFGVDTSKPPNSPRPRPTSKITKPVKNFRNNVPDIRLPRVTSTGPPLKHPSLQTPPPDQSSITFQQPPHPSSVSGARSTTVATMRHPYNVTPNRGNQRWGAASSGGSGTYKDDDDINDVASMAGVNLSEESARILATNSELVGTQTRSCKDDIVLNTALLQKRMSEIASRNPQIQHIHADAVKFLSCAAETRLKDVLQKLSTVVNHRLVNFKEEEHYQACGDVKTQLRFLQELDQIEKKKHEEAERDILMRAIKSRSKNDDPEKLRLKERAKEMQQQEMEKLQIRNADETARNAIGPRKKKSRLDPPLSSSGLLENHVGPSSSKNMTRSRTKTINLRDLMFVMEHEKDTCKSMSLYKSYLK